MVNDVREAVITALGQYFPDIDIYGEEIRQGFKEPCFFVKLFPVSQNREFGRRYRRNHAFDIHYFDATNEALHAMAEQLYQRMEYIQLSGQTIRGTGLHHEIVDGVVHFFVSYDFHVMREKASIPKMQELEQEGYLKNG
ncbi:phage tail terminator family protein [Desulforamulus ruminis]|uniref:phage tail terminator family protein n=1 Tax=Desulforamulus ruminis TaxID=1564 RepID=UPI0023524E2F|nr:hypothetical protein [Desulforamulus ruminis]